MKKKKLKLFRSPGLFITSGFAAVILIGTLLLLTPFATREGVSLSVPDALFTATSAVCVTGLVVVDTAESFTLFGQAVIAILIQIGGLGVASVGVGLVLFTGRKVSIRNRLLVKEALNIDSFTGIIRLLKSILAITFGFELIGAALSCLVFAKDYPLPKAIWISIFHSVAAFNNAGFDILGNMSSMIPYTDHVFLNIVTCILIILGGIGFLVMIDIVKNRRFKKWTLQSKVVVTTSIGLIVGGTLILKAVEDITWLQAFFQSVTTRTAGFSTVNLGTFSNAGLMVMCLLMFVGASPGSTGGGLKTSSFFILLQAMKSMFTKRKAQAFKRSISASNISRAYLIAILSIMVVYISTFLLCVAEPEYDFMQIFFEAVSAFSTAGLSTGITSGLGLAAKIILIVVMFTGRLGAVTLLTMWIGYSPSSVSYTEENIPIG